jgi:NAD(P)H-nitrite reductase large subunit
MSGCPRGGDCRSCLAFDGPVACHCLGVTEEEVISAVTTMDLRTLRDIRRQTRAGTGCNACHGRIQLLIETYSSSSAEICSAR